jgi:hypothetical protein
MSAGEEQMPTRGKPVQLDYAPPDPLPVFVPPERIGPSYKPVYWKDVGFLGRWLLMSSTHFAALMFAIVMYRETPGRALFWKRLFHVLLSPGIQAGEAIGEWAEPFATIANSFLWGLAFLSIIYGFRWLLRRRKGRHD